MIFNIFTIYFYIFFCSISVFGYGALFLKNILNSKNINPGLIGVLGFLVLFAISILIHFFYNLNQNLNFFILLLGFILGIQNIKIFYKITKYKNYFILIGFIFLLSIFSANSYADYEWYHLPYVNYLNSFKIVFGLVNVSNNYVYGHGWLDIIGMFNLPVIGTKGLTALPIIFYFYFIIFFLHELFNNKILTLKIFSIFTILVTLIVFNRLKDFGADIQPTFTLFIFIFYILKSSLEGDNEDILKFVVIFFFYSCVLRIGSVVSIPLFLFFFIIKFKKFFKEILKYNPKVYVFLILFFLSFLSKNFITTGCFFYPIPFTCFDNKSVFWASPSENVEERYELLTAIAKRWKFYSIEEGNLNSKYEYFEQIENEKIMSPKEYNSKQFYWIKYFFYDHDYKRLINIFIFSIIFLISLNFTLQKNNTLNINTNKTNLKYFFLGLLFCIVFWFFASPQMRYGGYPLISSFFAGIIVYLFRNKDIKEKSFRYFRFFFIFMAIFYFGYKNVNSSISDILNNNYKNFPWPNISQKIENIDYFSENYNGLEVNFIKKNDDVDLGSPKTCGEVSMLCMASGRKVCISKLFTKRNYIFVLNNNIECLEQFRKNYWQH